MHFEGQGKEEEKLEVHASLLSYKSMGRDEIRVMIPPGRSWRILTDPKMAQMDTQPHLLGPSRQPEGLHTRPCTKLSFTCFNSLNLHKTIPITR